MSRPRQRPLCGLLFLFNNFTPHYIHSGFVNRAAYIHTYIYTLWGVCALWTFYYFMYTGQISGNKFELLFKSRKCFPSSRLIKNNPYLQPYVAAKTDLSRGFALEAAGLIRSVLFFKDWCHLGFNNVLNVCLGVEARAVKRRWHVDSVDQSATLKHKQKKKKKVQRATAKSFNHTLKKLYKKKENRMSVIFFFAL